MSDDNYSNDLSEATEDINLGNISYDDFIDEYHSEEAEMYEDNSDD